jgi:hypothetical protein
MIDPLQSESEFIRRMPCFLLYYLLLSIAYLSTFSSLYQVYLACSVTHGGGGMEPNIATTMAHEVANTASAGPEPHPQLLILLTSLLGIVIYFFIVRNCSCCTKKKRRD